MSRTRSDFFRALEEAARVLDSAHTEARSVPGGIGLVKLLGRHAGFITAGATVVSQDVNFALSRSGSRNSKPKSKTVIVGKVVRGLLA